MNFRKCCFGLVLGSLAYSSFAAVEFKEAEITTVKNLVEHNPGTGAAPAKVNEKIYEKSTVSTAAASMAELTFADSSITRMGANTQFSFRSKERLVKLEQGTILIHTPPGNGGAKVDAGGVTAAVSGTTFMASRDMSGNTMFVLLEGQGGLKVTVGGVSTVIRPGQAASVGADSVKEAAAAPSDKGSAQLPAASGGGEDKGKGPGTGPAPAASGGGEGGGMPPAPAAPKIQVFDVDVKKVVSTTPLIVEFKNELPSAAKIEKTVEVQQTAVKEGKLEKLEVEVVAVKNKDGDLLVGAPRVEKEEMVVMNRRVDQPGVGRSGDGLDIETAAGPGGGAGPGTQAQTRAPAVSPPQPPAASGPATSVAGQIATTTATTAQGSPSVLDVTVTGGLVRASLDRAAVAGRNVAFSLPGSPWLSVSPSFAAIPAGSVSTGNLAVSLGNAQAFFPGWDANYNLRPVNLVATAGDLTDSVLTADLWPKAAIEAANPVRQLLSGPTDNNQLAGLDAFFYFQAKAPGVTDGPGQYFASLVSSTTTLDNIWTNPLFYSIGLYAGQDFDLFAAGDLTAAPGSSLFTHLPGSPPSSGDLANRSVVMFGRTVTWDSPGTVWGSLSSPLSDPTSPAFRAVNRYADYWTFDGITRQLGNFAFWDDSSIGSSLQLSGTSFLQAIDLDFASFREFVLVGGTGGIQITGLDIDTGGASLGIQAVGDLHLKTSRVIAGTANKVELESAGKVKLGAQTVSASPPTVAQAELEQVRIQATMPSSVPNLAIIRTADSFEMRNVSISGFSRVQLDGVSAPDSAGNRAVTGRVLLNASAVMTAGSTAHLKIREMVGAAVNADSKIQMMALDNSGELAGTMLVGLENSVNRVNLPVEGRVISGAYVDTHAVDLAARRIEFQNLNLAAMNSITARANTVLIQNSLMTVVQTGGFINMYVQSGQVNPVYNSVVDGKLNFAGNFNGFNIGGNNFTVSNQTELNNQLGVNILEATQHLGVPQPGKLNVFSL